MEYAILILKERLDVINYQMDKIYNKIGSSVHTEIIGLKKELTDAISILEKAENNPGS